MSIRSNGLYWCKVKQSEEWFAIEWAGGKWVVGLIDCQADVVQVGPRIPAPDESISREKKASVLFEVAEKLGKYYDPCVASGMRHMAYQLEAAAPKPEDV
ncbi:hypothetical protein [Vreelandella venusta]|uniref:hypothetical protein n=1 Tax=Vreelandella venusta TaxID=44935 RepID=UPI003AA8D441